MRTKTNTSDECRNLAGPRIREIRDNIGMTQRQMVENLRKYGVKITACTLSKIETTKRSITDIELVAFVKTLNITVDKLIDFN